MVYHIPMHGHDHACRAPSTLGTIIISQSLLDRMETFLLTPKSLCSGDLVAIAGKHRTQALNQEALCQLFSCSLEVF